MSDFQNNRRQSEKVSSAREHIRRDASYKFITPDEYSQMIVSNSHLQRFELQDADLIVLRDPYSGVNYAIEAEQLGTDRTW